MSISSLPWSRLAVLAAAVLLIAFAHGRIDTASRADQGEMFVPRPEQARLSTFGFDALLADYYWLQAVQIVGGEERGVGDKAPLLAKLIDVVTTLDPWVGHPYRFAAVWLTESVEMVLHANRLLERATAYAPRDWRNHHYLGFNYFYYLGEDEKAAKTLERAALLPGSPPYLGPLVAKLRKAGSGLETAEAFLVQLAADTEDEFARAEYLKALDEVATEKRARVLDAAREEYRRRFGRDLTRVEDLVHGPDRVLRRLPPPHPHFEGFRWELDAQGRIVSSFYGARYETRVHHMDRERREKWSREYEALARERG